MKALATYQVILLGEQRHIRCEQLAQGRCPNNVAVGVEPVTSWSRVQRPTATLPSHLKNGLRTMDTDHTQHFKFLTRGREIFLKQREIFQFWSDLIPDTQPVMPAVWSLSSSSFGSSGWTGSRVACFDLIVLRACLQYRLLTYNNCTRALCSNTQTTWSKSTHTQSHKSVS